MQFPSTSSLEFIHKEWPVIKAAPYSFFGSLGILLFISWVFLRLLYRGRIDRHKETIGLLERDIVRLKESSATMPKVEAQRELCDAFKNPRYEIVGGYVFVNQAIEVDGKSFRDCSFTNITFIYNGNGPTEFIGCLFHKSITLESRNPALIEFAQLQKVLRSIPGGEIGRDGVLDAKGKLLSGKFALVPVNPQSPESTSISPGLCSRVLVLCKELRDFLKEYGPEPKAARKPGDSDHDVVDDFYKTVVPWRQKFQADFRLRFADRVGRIRDEVRVVGVSDGALDDAINKAINSPNGEVKAVEEIATKLWTFALNLDD
jgi:hypothetical protein